MHADGYAGFEDLYRSGAIREVACMAHVRRKFVDIHRSQGSPIAEEAIGRIAKLYAVEKEARGCRASTSLSGADNQGGRFWPLRSDRLGDGFLLHVVGGIGCEVVAGGCRSGVRLG